MLASHRSNGSGFSSLLVRLVVALLVCFYCDPAHAAQNQPSAQAILQHFYQVAGGNAWQHFEMCDSDGTAKVAEMCDSDGTAKVAGKTGSLALCRGPAQRRQSVSLVEIPALEVKRADGDGPMQSWHQDADGDIQLSNPDSPDNIDDRYLTRHAYWLPEFGGAAVTLLTPEAEGSTTWDQLRFRVHGGSGFTLWINHQTRGLSLVAWRAKTTKELSDYTARSMASCCHLRRKSQAGSEMLTVLYTQRTLRQDLDTTAFYAIPFRKDYQMPPSGSVSVAAEGGLHLSSHDRRQRAVQGSL